MTRILLFTILSLFHYSISAQEKATNLEFSFIPLLKVNHAYVGCSFQQENGHEHTLMIGGNLGFVPTFMDVNVSYSFNYRFKNKNLYIPLWVRVRNARREIGFEQGYFPHFLRYSVGVGIGSLKKLNESWFLRSEIGIGGSLNYTNPIGAVFPFRLDLENYGVDQYYPNYNPPTIWAARLKIGLVYKFGKSN
jgi:hypothetical protein